MSNIRLSSRYAKSLLELCNERNELDSVLNDMKSIIAGTSGNRDLSLLLSSPVVSGDKKMAVLRAVFTSWSSTTSAFVSLIVSKGRESELAAIAAAFIDQVNTLRGIHQAEVISAVELDEKAKTAVLKIAESIADGKVNLKEQINPDLIGGFILRVNGKEYNSSVIGKLNKIKKDFSKNPYVPSL
ncbi:MAG: ATP synthase F1 subunit delta [Bacteroidota bacterium]